MRFRRQLTGLVNEFQTWWVYGRLHRKICEGYWREAHGFPIRISETGALDRSWTRKILIRFLKTPPPHLFAAPYLPGNRQNYPRLPAERFPSSQVRLFSPHGFPAKNPGAWWDAGRPPWPGRYDRYSRYSSGFPARPGQRGAQEVGYWYGFGFYSIFGVDNYSGCSELIGSRFKVQGSKVKINAWKSLYW